MGDRAATLERAVREISLLPGTTLVACSEFINTSPVSSVPQGDYLNGAATIRTSLPPLELLRALLDIELRFGRERSAGVRWGPRTLDLDLLAYGQLEIREPGLTLPHPRMHERRFVLEPLAEIAPNLVIPGRGTVAELLQALSPAE